MSRIASGDSWRGLSEVKTAVTAIFTAMAAISGRLSGRGRAAAAPPRSAAGRGCGSPMVWNHVLQRIGRMGVVDDGRAVPFAARDLRRLLTACSARSTRAAPAPVESQQRCRAVDRQQVVGEPPQQLPPTTPARRCAEACRRGASRRSCSGNRPSHAANRRAHRRRGVHHHASVPVVGVRQSESPFWAAVEKEFLARMYSAKVGSRGGRG